VRGFKSAGSGRIETTLRAFRGKVDDLDHTFIAQRVIQGLNGGGGVRGEGASRGVLQKKPTLVVKAMVNQVQREQGGRSQKKKRHNQVMEEIGDL